MRLKILIDAREWYILFVAVQRKNWLNFKKLCYFKTLKYFICALS